MQFVTWKSLSGALFVAAMSGGFAGGASAQSFLSSGYSWGGSYYFPSDAQRSNRAATADLMKRAEEGYYDTFGAAIMTYNTTNNYDSSVGDITVNAEAGANVDLETRTAEGTGTSSYSVGSINTSVNNIDISGNNAGNNLTLTNSAVSEGCQDASINTSVTSGLGGIDISSSGATAIAGISGAGASASSMTCNR